MPPSIARVLTSALLLGDREFEEYHLINTMLLVLSKQ